MINLRKSKGKAGKELLKKILINHPGNLREK